MMTFRAVRRILGLAVVPFFFVIVTGLPAAFAQTTDTSGIQGKVTDETGGVLPGVSVTVTSPALQVPQVTAVTDASGMYRFAALPAGLYTVNYELSGFRSIRREEFKVGGGFTAVLDVKLGVGAVAETVTVTGAAPLVDVRNTSTQTNISSELIATLPTSRTFYEVLNMAEGVRTTTVDVGGNMASDSGGRSSGKTGGTNAGGYTSLLDGINTIATAGYYDTGAIEDVVVRSGGSDAEMSAPGFSFLGVIKTGGNQFHGSAQGQYQNEKLQSSNITPKLQALGVTQGNPMVSYYDAAADFGGRVIRDRLWFYAGVRNQQYKSKAIGYSVDKGPDGVYGTADDTYGFASSSLPNFVTKVSAQVTSRQKVSWMYHHDGKNVPDRGGSVFKPREAAGIYTLPNSVTKVDWSYAPTSNTLLSALGGRTWWISYQYPYTDGTSTMDTVTQQLRGAVINSSGTDSDPAGSYSSSYQYYFNVSHLTQNFLGGNHDFKAGVEWYHDHYNKEQLLRGPVGSCGGPSGTTCGGTGKDYLLLLFNGAPLDVLLRNTPFLALNNVDHRNGYVKDSWQLGDRLTVNLGVRLDWSVGYLPAQSKVAGPFSPAASFPYKKIWDWVLPAPRTGVAYALTADKKTVVRASWGRFGFWVSPNEGGSILRDYNQNDYGDVRYHWIDVNGNGDFDYNPADPFSSPELGAFVSTGGAKSTVYRPVTQPKSQEVTTFVERELSHVLSIKAGYVYKKLYNQYKLVNTARPFAAYNIPITTVDPGKDGVIGTADDGGPITYYDYDPAYKGTAFEQSAYLNFPNDTNTYNSIELDVNRRFANKFQSSLSFLATKANVFHTPWTPNDVPFDRDLTWERSFKANGSYEAPWGIYTGVSYNFLSGAPQQRTAVFRTGLKQLSTVTLRMETLGATQLAGLHLLNIRAAKKLAVSGSRSLELQFDVQNALNRSTIQTQSVVSGPAYGTVSLILPPRVGRVGLSYKF